MRFRFTLRDWLWLVVVVAVLLLSHLERQQWTREKIDLRKEVQRLDALSDALQAKILVMDDRIDVLDLETDGIGVLEVRIEEMDPKESGCGVAFGPLCIGGPFCLLRCRSARFTLSGWLVFIRLRSRLANPCQTLSHIADR